MTGNNSGIIVQERDRHLLRELAVMRVIDREQAKAVARFGSTTRANTRLLGLTRARLLRRFFLGTTRAGWKAIYALSQQGADLVGVPYRGLQRRRDQILVADSFVAHQLAVNEVYCTLKYGARPVDAHFVRWLAFFDPVAAGTVLIPDGYAEVNVSARTLSMFVEVDLGTETRGVWQRKVEAYVSFAASGKFAEHFALPQFRTLVIVNSERRSTSLREVTAKLTDRIFWFATSGAIAQQGFWAAIWQRPRTDDHQRLY